METKEPAENCIRAPDGSEIRELLCAKGGSMVHCTLPVGGVSMAVAHRTVEELWFFLKGRGEVWRKVGDVEEVVEVGPSVSLDIPLGGHFQFRNTGPEPLEFIIATMPPWPGADEAVRVADHWPVA
ncbi:MAG: cupin domain-containing protein [Alphaproteobacteria bacterium]|nr:cupin domain-containing protein [Pseudomonadota bacterium]